MIITLSLHSTTMQKVIATYTPSIHKWTLALKGTTSGETLEVEKKHIWLRSSLETRPENWMEPYSYLYFL